jgi:hypothetical protein
MKPPPGNPGRFKTDFLPLSFMTMGMKAQVAHSLLLTCIAPQQALKDFGEAIVKGRIPATASVIYLDTGHEGDHAKLKPYWRRITQNAQEAAVWTEARASLPSLGEKLAVELTDIEFDDATVEEFVNQRRPVKPKRGKKRIQDEWTPFWVAAAQLAKAGILNKGHFPTQKDLCERLHTMMGATLDVQTIKPFAAIIYQQVAAPSVTEIEEMVAESD